MSDSRYAEPDWQYWRAEQNITHQSCLQPDTCPAQCPPRERIPSLSWNSFQERRELLSSPLGKHCCGKNGLSDDWENDCIKWLLMLTISPFQDPLFNGGLISSIQPLPTVPQPLGAVTCPWLQWSHAGKARIFPKTCFLSRKLRHEFTLAFELLKPSNCLETGSSTSS